MVLDKNESIKKLNTQIKICKACPLYKGTHNAVPGEGSLDAKIMFIGEGPGYWEDQKGRPFVGQAGNLLDNLIEKIGLKRKDVFIGNVVKHRPPGNRDPEPGEIETCSKWLDSQIDIINPKIIVTLGRFSMAKFIPGVAISQIHGQPRFTNWKGNKIIIIPMYHPAAALRSGNVANLLEADFLKIPRFLKEGMPEIKKEKNEEPKQKEPEVNQLSFI